MFLGRLTVKLPIVSFNLIFLIHFTGLFISALPCINSSTLLIFLESSSDRNSKVKLTSSLILKSCFSAVISGCAIISGSKNANPVDELSR